MLSFSELDVIAHTPHIKFELFCCAFCWEFVSVHHHAQTHTGQVTWGGDGRSSGVTKIKTISDCSLGRVTIKCVRLIAGKSHLCSVY